MPHRDDRVTAARPALIRALNWKTVVDLLRRMGPLSRADIVRLTGMSKPTVTLALDAAEAADLVRKAGYRTGMAGPSPLLYGISPAAGHVLAIDVGRQFTRFAVTDLTGTAIGKATFESTADGSDSDVETVISRARSVLDEAGLTSADLRQTVIGAPGVFNPEEGVLRLTGHLADWGGNPDVIRALRAAFGPEVLFENDIDASAIAEWQDGHGRTVDTFAFVSIGTGVGMGLIVNRELHRGAHGAAGEIAFLPISGGAGPDDADTLQRGQFESSASGPAVVRAAHASGLRNAASAAAVFRSAQEGDPLAQAVVDVEAHLIAKALAAIVAVVDPELIVIGGGIGRSSGFAESVSARLDQLVPVRPPVVVSALGEDAVLRGAIALGLAEVWDQITSAPDLPEVWRPDHRAQA